jgi:hypothetical protein
MSIVALFPTINNLENSEITSLQCQKLRFIVLYGTLNEDAEEKIYQVVDI